jgi:hypothetical protein
MPTPTAGATGPIALLLLEKGAIYRGRRCSSMVLSGPAAAE